jgi:Putative adhesin
MRPTVLLVLAAVAAGLPAAAQDTDGHRIVIRERARLAAYQGRNRGQEQTERFSRRIHIGRDGRVAVSNVAGDITVTGGGGDEVTIDAVKRTRGDRSQLARVHIDVDERPGRVEVRTEYERNWSDRSGDVSVDYTITVPSSAAVDVKSVSGTVKLSNVQGAVRAESVSGDVITSSTPKLELAKSVSGDVSLGGVTTDGDLSATSVSGSVSAKGLKARGLDLGSVSGNVTIADATCDRLDGKSVSGNIEYQGSIVKAGRYSINTHSGTIRLTLSGSTGFELTANTFSGNVRSDLPITIGGSSDSRSGRRRYGPGRSIRGTVGDGSATLVVRTFSGDIVIEKR